MITLFVILILINLIPSQLSFTGRKLLLMQHAWIVRLRFLGIGMAFVLMAARPSVSSNSWLWWLTFSMLLLTAARLPEDSEVVRKSSEAALLPKV